MSLRNTKSLPVDDPLARLGSNPYTRFLNSHVPLAAPKKEVRKEDTQDLGLRLNVNHACVFRSLG